jgi:serine/threonine protein kinase
LSRSVVQISTNESDPNESALDASIGPIRRFGRYTLIKKLATGGMAEIWLARQSGVAGFNRFVVIKKILSHLAEEETFRNMFLDEARMSAALTHPNIVQVYDLGEADETYFIAMEFILGENLAAIAWRGVKRQSPLSPVFAARIMADACKALDYAHRLKGSNGVPLEIVHRDISPQNILVTYEGEVKVVDFGIAKAASKSQHTKTGMLKGKFSYMSPEQCLGHNVDRRGDVFALGIVLYELCTGKRLFKHESELMILEMITKRRITPPSEVASNIPAELERIIMKALEKDVDVRFATAQDFQIELEDFIRGQTEPAASGDIAAYMRSHFRDKIEEKRRLQELASRDDFGGNATFADDEATERARPQHLARRQTGQRAQPAVSYPPKLAAIAQIQVKNVVNTTTHPPGSVPNAPLGTGTLPRVGVPASPQAANKVGDARDAAVRAAIDALQDALVAIARDADLRARLAALAAADRRSPAMADFRSAVELAEGLMSRYDAGVRDASRVEAAVSAAERALAEAPVAIAREAELRARLATLAAVDRRSPAMADFRSAVELAEGLMVRYIAGMREASRVEAAVSAAERALEVGIALVPVHEEILLLERQIRDSTACLLPDGIHRVLCWETRDIQASRTTAISPSRMTGYRDTLRRFARKIDDTIAMVNAEVNAAVNAHAKRYALVRREESAWRERSDGATFTVNSLWAALLWIPALYYVANTHGYHGEYVVLSALVGYIAGGSGLRALLHSRERRGFAYRFAAVETSFLKALTTIRPSADELGIQLDEQHLIQRYRTQGGGAAS